MASLSSAPLRILLEENKHRPGAASKNGGGRGDREMKVLQKLKSLPHHLPTGTASQSGIKGFAIDKGERYAAAFLYGAAKTYYGPAFNWRGYGLDLWTGAALTLGSAFLHTSSSPSLRRLASHAERVGDAGMMVAFASLGADFGMKKSGRSVAVLPARGIKGDVVGDLPAAKAGPYLSHEDLMNFANRR